MASAIPSLIAGSKAKTVLQLQRVGGTKGRKGPKGNPLNENDLDGPFVGPYAESGDEDKGTGPHVGPDGPLSVPMQFHTKGTSQTIENTTTYADVPEGPFVPPGIFKTGSASTQSPLKTA